nr:myozenin-1-like isoform X2 [Petromyzon marinus]
MAPPAPPKSNRPTRSRTPAIAIVDENDPFHMKKLSVPRDIMMEELSLLANKGSQLFKIRRKRADKYTYESEGTAGHYSYDHQGNPYIAYGSGGGVGAAGHHVLIYGQNGAGGHGAGGHGAGGHGAGGHGEGGGGAGGQHGGGHGGGQGGGAGGQHGGGAGGGGGGGGVNGPHSGSGPLQEQVNSVCPPVHKAYLSPWDQAIGGEPQLLAGLTQQPLGPPGPREPYADYRSFNRKALPYGGFELASRLSSFVMPKLTFTAPVTPEVTHDGVPQRPNFNRSPQGWASVYPLDEAAQLLLLTAREQRQSREDPDEDL